MVYFQIQSLGKPTKVIACRNGTTRAEIAKAYSVNGAIVLQVSNISREQYDARKLIESGDAKLVWHDGSKQVSKPHSEQLMRSLEAYNIPYKIF